MGVTEKLVLSASTDLTNKLNALSGFTKQWFDILFEVLVLSIDLCRDFEFHPGLAGDSNGSIQSLLT